MNTAPVLEIQAHEPMRDNARVIALKPRITVSTLARAMGPLTLNALTRLLRGHKYQCDGPRRSYQCARRQAIAHLVDKTPFNPDEPLRAHEREAIQAMQRMRISPPEWVRAVRAVRAVRQNNYVANRAANENGRHPLWELEGLSVSMQPDVELEGYLASGAAKFVFTKDPLPRGVGSALAALMWHYRRHVLDIVTTRACNCMVYEPRLPWVHLPGVKPDRQVRAAEVACKVIAALWPSV